MGKLIVPEYDQEQGISLLTIGDRVYRKSTLRARQVSAAATSSSSASTTATSSHTKWQEDDGNSDTDEPIEQHDDGSVSLKFLVPSALMGFLIGKVRSCAFDIVVA